MALKTETRTIEVGFKTETRTVEGFEVTVQVLPATRSLLLLPRVTKMVGAAIASGAGAESDLSSIFLHADGTELLSLATELLCSAQVKHEGQLRTLDRKTIDLVYTGQIKALLAAAWFAVEVNYADFFDGVSATKPDEETKAEAETSPA